MTSIKNQFTSNLITNFFEKDTHIGVGRLKVDKIRILSGSTSEEDIIVIVYESSPMLSFYNSKGELIDVDHYLPDYYEDQDAKGAAGVIENLRDVDLKALKSRKSFNRLLRETYEEGKDSLSLGLIKKFGLET